MKKIITIGFLCLLFYTTRGQEALSKILGQYIPYIPFEKPIDSLFSFYEKNNNFKTDSASSSFLTGELKNFNPPGLSPSRLVIAIKKESDNPFSYTVWICFDTLAASKKIVQLELEKLHKQVARYFSKSIDKETGKKDKFPFKVYNYFSTGGTSPVMLTLWGYNESSVFTGYFLAVTFFLTVQ